MPEPNVPESYNVLVRELHGPRASKLDSTDFGF
jgi:hypothetical protein